MRLRTSARLRSISACLAFLACKQNRIQRSVSIAYGQRYRYRFSYRKRTCRWHTQMTLDLGFLVDWRLREHFLDLANWRLRPHTRTPVYLLGLHFGIVGILWRAGGRGSRFAICSGRGSRFAIRSGGGGGLSIGSGSSSCGSWSWCSWRRGSLFLQLHREDRTIND